MSDIGYNGRALLVQRDPSGGYATIAAIQSKSITHARELIDVTTDDDSGWRRLLPNPGSRSINASIEGVITSGNSHLLDSWAGNVMDDIKLVYPDGATATAEDGFGISNVEITGEQDGNVAFTAEFQSSGPVTYTAAT